MGGSSGGSAIGGSTLCDNAIGVTDDLCKAAGGDGCTGSCESEDSASDEEYDVEDYDVEEYDTDDSAGGESGGGGGSGGRHDQSTGGGDGDGNNGVVFPSWFLNSTTVTACLAGGEDYINDRLESELPGGIAADSFVGSQLLWKTRPIVKIYKCDLLSAAESTSGELGML